MSILEKESLKAEIITIGDEILIGQIVDTNSTWIANQLTFAGIQVHQVSSVSDNREHILEALEQASQRANIILLTGGLGPTKDDITKKVLAEYFQSEKMEIHQASLKFVTERLALRGYPMSELNRKQTEMPNNCTVIPNKDGTAPGMWFEKNNKVFVSMPGVPAEMRLMLSDVLIRLNKKYKLNSIFYKTMLSFGIGESYLSEIIADWENALPKNIKLAYLPDINNGVKLRLSAYGSNLKNLEREVDAEFEKCKLLIPNAFYGFLPDTLQSVIGKLLIEKGKTLAVAESCTGGRIAHRITKVPGSSKYFNAGVVSYSNQSKIDILGVNSEDIAKYGAVSEQVALQMAEGARRVLKSDYAIATTGIAGPDGGTQEKPVGLCWIAIVGPKGEQAYKQIFVNDRLGNIASTTSFALYYLQQMLVE